MFTNQDVHGKPAIVEYKGGKAVSVTEVKVKTDSGEYIDNFWEAVFEKGIDGSELGWSPKIGSTGYLDQLEGMPTDKKVVYGMDEWGRSFVVIRVRSQTVFPSKAARISERIFSIFYRYQNDTGPMVMAGNTPPDGIEKGKNLYFCGPLDSNTLDPLTRLIKDGILTYTRLVDGDEKELQITLTL